METVQQQSLMPDGLLSKLSDDDVRDLVGYLMSPEQVPLPAAADATNDSSSDVGGAPDRPAEEASAPRPRRPASR
jgi:hypothetical protein